MPSNPTKSPSADARNDRRRHRRRRHPRLDGGSRLDRACRDGTGSTATRPRPCKQAIVGGPAQERHPPDRRWHGRLRDHASPATTPMVPAAAARHRRAPAHRFVHDLLHATRTAPSAGCPTTCPTRRRRAPPGRPAARRTTMRSRSTSTATRSPTLTEIAKANGLRTGDVSTAEIQDATPAVQVAHVDQRSCYGPDSRHLR